MFWTLSIFCLRSVFALATISLSLSRTIVHLQVLWMIESERELLRAHEISLQPGQFSPAWSVELCPVFVTLSSSCSVPSLQKLSIEGEYLSRGLVGRIAASPSMWKIVFFRPHARNCSTTVDTTYVAGLFSSALIALTTSWDAVYRIRSSFHWPWQSPCHILPFASEM